jgi:hypothetical protein
MVIRPYTKVHHLLEFTGIQRPSRILGYQSSRKSTLAKGCTAALHRNAAACYVCLSQTTGAVQQCSSTSFSRLSLYLNHHLWIAEMGVWRNGA